MDATYKTSVLIEALPYLQAFRGQTFLIKMGGSAMENPDLVKQVMCDIVFLEVCGINPVVVHGGGKAISAAMEEAGLKAEFVGGFRVTSPEAMAIVERTLSNTINLGLVTMIQDHGAKATGLRGTDVFIGERIDGIDENGVAHDIGLVGCVVASQLAQIHEALASEIIPVISPVALERGTGKPLNVNADLAAAALAKDLKVSKLIYLSDVPGVLENKDDPSSLIPTITPSKADILIQDKIISGGMLPKIYSALNALDAGVEKVHFIDGRTPHSLLLEIFTQSGIGTEITK
jgi:acetylglutamate kinase